MAVAGSWAFVSAPTEGRADLGPGRSLWSVGRVECHANLSKCARIPTISHQVSKLSSSSYASFSTSGRRLSSAPKVQISDGSQQLDTGNISLQSLWSHFRWMQLLSFSFLVMRCYDRKVMCIIGVADIDDDQKASVWDVSSSQGGVQQEAGWDLSWLPSFPHVITAAMANFLFGYHIGSAAVPLLSFMKVDDFNFKRWKEFGLMFIKKMERRVKFWSHFRNVSNFHWHSSLAILWQFPKQIWWTVKSESVI